VGADGATHHGAFDLSYLRCIPNLVVMAPGDENECRQMLYTGFLHEGPSAVRYPRGTALGVPVDQEMRALPIGKGELRRRGRRVVILAFGTLLKTALEAAEELDATVVNMRFVKPLDESLALEMARTHELVVTLEENAVMGGAGSAVGEFYAASGMQVPLLQLGLPDRFVDHGDQAQLLAAIGLDAPGVVGAIRGRLGTARAAAAA
jgi:1-deoxy-D-xylulose-5-phosphate synthase